MVAPGFRISRPSALVLATFAVVVLLAWLATIATSSNLANLMMTQLGGAAPVDRIVFLGLVGVMMGAMMLPAALPMLNAYRGLSTLDSSPREGSVRTVLFSTSYLVLWLAFTGAALVLLVALGVMGMLSGFAIFVPAIVLVGAGVYQFTTWKTYCLSQCRSPVGFVMTNWKSGRTGALRMGFEHGLFCLGCCWVLMLVVFVTGAMSLLWMVGFSGLVLVEKVWSRGEFFAKLLGATSVIAGGGLALVLALGAGLVP